MTETKRNVILTGFMATGKTSVGKALAARLGYEFVDLDSLIEAEAGMPISRIFATQGEERFRELESRMVMQVARRDASIIATGGGAIVNPRNLEALQRSGVVIALTAKPEAILARVGSGEDRPMLWGGEPLERIRRLLADRAPAYAKADLTVDTTEQSIDQVVGHILNALQARRGGPSEAGS
ncbi:MAG TPA: shikimate kinase [Candidatus Methylomirabilis sp.]|nr:shikimate kinase [Candidatus Methylomirabilis sp.]